MTERPIYFKTFAEIEARPNFDATCGITPESITSLVGEYHCVNDDERKCQRQTATGLCAEDHRNGWVGRRTDGKEVLIGRNCGIEHFKASAVFATERSRVTREHTLDGLLNRLQATTGSAAYRDQAKATLERARALRDHINSIKARFPDSVQRELEEMAQRGDAGLHVEYRYEEPSEKGGNAKPVVQWVRQRVAGVSGLKMWSDLELRAVLAELHTIRDTLGTVQLMRELGARKLKAWADALDRLPHCVTTLEQLDAAAAAFFEPFNVRWLCLIPRDHADALVVAHLVLELAGSPGNAIAAEKFKRDLAAEIRSRAGGRDFKVV